MGGLWKEVNNFFTSTSIHGFPYISNTNERSTRIIWSIILFLGFGAATFFLYETIGGFNEKYVTTTVETRSIQDYPFPAITFHPGDFNSKDAFLRDFLNEFEFVRFDKNSSLRSNEKFMNLYQWLISQTSNDEFFDDIEK